MASGRQQEPPALRGRKAPPCLVREHGDPHRHPAKEPEEHRERGNLHLDRVTDGLSPTARGRELRKESARLVRLRGIQVDQDDDASLDTETLFAEAIREHLALKSRNSGLDGNMPLEPYLEEDPLENHPLFKSEEQARIEETMDGEPAAELSAERMTWPGEETVESVEGAALDEALWSGGPRDFDWGD